MNIAVVPARAGSKRIPGKNIRPFCGKPLLAYPIEAARASGLFDHIVVTTDSAQFAAIARQYGAETPFLRPKELAGDHIATRPVINHALNWIRKNWGPVARYCQFYANPFITKESITASYRLLQQTGANTVIGVTEKLLSTVDYSMSQQRRRGGRSLFIVRDIKKGERFSQENVRSIRPGHGCSPNLLPEIINKTAAHDLKKGTPMEMRFVADGLQP